MFRMLVVLWTRSFDTVTAEDANRRHAVVEPDGRSPDFAPPSLGQKFALGNGEFFFR
jgi:hypothetical protein